MPKTITSGSGHCPGAAATRALAELALELHRAALTAEELQHAASRRAPRETNGRGAQDPTATAVLDPRRQAVAAALAETARRAGSLASEVGAVLSLLSEAVDQWDA